MQQQMGVPPIITQQLQPAFIHAAMQSQQLWIISQQALSPLVQVIAHPSGVISHLHRPQVRLQQQTIIPFIMQQQLTIPPAIIWQRFCIIAQAAVSSQEQVIFMPVAVFSSFIVQRGTMTMLGAIGFIIAGATAPAPMPTEAFDRPVRAIGFVIAVTIGDFLDSGIDRHSGW